MPFASTLLRLAGTLPIALSVAIASCGGGDSSSTTATASPASAVPAGAPLIDQESLAFHPEKLTVKAGEKVYFQNSESSLHTVNINGKNASGNMKRRDLFVWTPDAVGAYKITCEYHPQMRATITVE